MRACSSGMQQTRGMPQWRSGAVPFRYVGSGVFPLLSNINSFHTPMATAIFSVMVPSGIKEGEQLQANTPGGAMIVTVRRDNIQ